MFGWLRALTRRIVSSNRSWNRSVPDISGRISLTVTVRPVVVSLASNTVVLAPSLTNRASTNRSATTRPSRSDGSEGPPGGDSLVLTMNERYRLPPSAW